MYSDKELKNRFSHHAPAGDQAVRYEIIRGVLESTARLIRDLTPISPDQMRAFYALDDVMFRANAAIARSPDSDLPPMPEIINLPPTTVMKAAKPENAAPDKKPGPCACASCRAQRAKQNGAPDRARWDGITAEHVLIVGDGAHTVAICPCKTCESVRNLLGVCPA